MSNRQILVIEDEQAISIAIADVLEDAEYVVVVHGTLALADGYLGHRDPALVILDRMLPDGDGLAWLKARRNNDWRVPCMVLSARGTEEDRCEGLEAGADDYMAKPFSPRELTARVDAIMRRAPIDTGHIVRVGTAVINLEARQIGKFNLTDREFRLLSYLRAHAGRVVTRDELLHHVWDFEHGSNAATRAIDMCVVGLRRKMGDGAHRLKTIRGGGYLLDLGKK
jgi:DNA-binding response OmpR family regulator